MVHLANPDVQLIRDGPPARTRPARWLAVALSVAALGLAACGSDDEDGDDGTAGGPEADSQPPVDPMPGEPILIQTRMKMFAGKVLAGSVIGDSPFCPGGTVRHEDGSPEIGFPAVNVFRCPDGQLKVGFGPGPDQMNDLVQTSEWEILAGSGRFAGIAGDGQMIVQWPRLGAMRGQETFTGMVSR